MFEKGDRVVIAFPDKTSIECGLAGLSGKIILYDSETTNVLLDNWSGAKNVDVEFMTEELVLELVYNSPLMKALKEY